MAPRMYIIALLLSLAQLATAQSITRIDGSRITRDSLDRRITRLMAKANVAGLAISILNKNVPVYHKAFGYANTTDKKTLTTSHVMYSASFSKAVFTYIAMRVIETGVMHLDTPLVSYLKKPLMDYKFRPGDGYEDLRNDTRYKKITARMCLSHTSGFGNYRSEDPEGKLRIYFEPGTRYSYSGEGMGYLQFVLEQVTGQDFEALAQQKVFHPLHMTHSSYISRDAFAPKLANGHDGAARPYPLGKTTYPGLLCHYAHHTR